MQNNLFIYLFFLQGKYQLKLKEDHIRVEMEIQSLFLWKTHREYHSHVNKHPSYLIPLAGKC